MKKQRGLQVEEAVAESEAIKTKKAGCDKKRNGCSHRPWELKSNVSCTVTHGYKSNIFFLWWQITANSDFQGHRCLNDKV